MNNSLKIEKAKEVFLKRCKDAVHFASIRFFITFLGYLCLKTDDGELWSLNDGTENLHIEDIMLDKREKVFNKKREVLDNKLFLEVLKKSRDHDIFLISKKVLSRGETLENLLIEDDLLKK